MLSRFTVSWYYLTNWYIFLLHSYRKGLVLPSNKPCVC